MARRARGSGSLSLDGRGLWTAGIELPSATGKRRRKVFRSKDRETAVAKLRAYLRLHPGLINPSRVHQPFEDELAEVTVSDWLTEWLTNVAPEEVRPKTLGGYSTIVRRQIEPTIGHIAIRDLRARDVRQMSASIQAAGLSPTTANQAHRVLSVALTAAQRDEVVERNVAKLIPPPRKARSPQQALTLEECHRVLQAARGQPLESMWYAALFSGARQGELLGMQRQLMDADFMEISWQLQRLSWRHGCGGNCGWARGSDCPMKVVPAPADWESRHLTGGLWLTRPKSRAGRRLIPVVGAFRQAIQDHLALADDPNPFGLVWHMPDGKPIDPKLHLRMWYRLLDRAGVKRVRFHDARHTAVDMLYSANVPEDVIRELVGHSTWETTRLYKTPMNRARLAAAMESVGVLLDSQSESSDRRSRELVGNTAHSER